MTVTILDLMNRLPDIATAHQGDMVKSQCPYITIITGVPRELPPTTDFELNGKVLISAPFNDVVRKFGSSTISEICDLTKKNFKIAWSKEVIDPLDESALFKLDLSLRVTSFDESTKTINFVALRNKYGSSTITLTHQFKS